MKMNGDSGQPRRAAVKRRVVARRRFRFQVVAPSGPKEIAAEVVVDAVHFPAALVDDRNGFRGDEAATARDQYLLHTPISTRSCWVWTLRWMGLTTI